MTQAGKLKISYNIALPYFPYSKSVTMLCWFYLKIFFLNLDLFLFLLCLGEHMIIPHQNYYNILVTGLLTPSLPPSNLSPTVLPEWFFWNEKHFSPSGLSLSLGKLNPFDLPLSLASCLANLRSVPMHAGLFGPLKLYVIHAIATSPQCSSFLILSSFISFVQFLLKF